MPFTTSHAEILGCLSQWVRLEFLVRQVVSLALIVIGMKKFVSWGIEILLYLFPILQLNELSARMKWRLISFIFHMSRFH